MSDVFAKHASKQKAVEIADAMKARGYNVLWREGTEDYVTIGFDLIGNPELPWCRAFNVEAIHATPELFEGQINDWKRGVQASISAGEVSDTLHSVIAHYGAERVSKALTEKRYN